jgi:hypothetical protein
MIKIVNSVMRDTIEMIKNFEYQETKHALSCDLEKKVINRRPKVLSEFIIGYLFLEIIKRETNRHSVCPSSDK